MSASEFAERFGAEPVGMVSDRTDLFALLEFGRRLETLGNRSVDVP